MINNFSLSFIREFPPKFILEFLWTFQGGLDVARETRLSLSQSYSGSVHRIAGGCIARLLWQLVQGDDLNVSRMYLNDPWVCT